MPEGAPGAAGRRRAGPSLRAKLALSYAGFLFLATLALGGLMLVVLAYVPDDNLVVAGTGGFVPNRSDLLRVALPLVAVGFVFLAVTGVLGGWVLAGRVLRPVGSIVEAARAAAGGSLGHRIDLDGPDDELRRLADDFDRMLARLEESFAEQQRFTANASHELRTPHAVMKTMLQVALADPPCPGSVPVLSRLEEMNDRSTRTLEALLLLSRADRSVMAQERIDLVDVVRGALGRAADALAGVDLELQLPSPGVAVVVGDRELVDRLTDNLLGNAVTHNHPAGGTVWVRVDPDGGGAARLTVASTGEALDASTVRTLTEPFVRAGGRSGSAGRAAGSGLGLSIVSSVARAHGGEVRLHARPEGGLEVVVDLPATGSVP